jgi:hypothetical protein
VRAETVVDRHEQEHQDRGRTLAAAPSALGGAPEVSELSGFATD